MVDLISVYYSYRLEQDDNLPKLPPGHRAISAVAVTYTLTNHDYLKTAAHGFTYRMLIGTMKSPSYNKEMKEYDKEKMSPVNFTRQAVFLGQNHNRTKGYNLPGILILLHHTFINRSETRKLLLKKYKPECLSAGLAFTTVRAASILAGEIHPVPDPISIMAHISCCSLIFRRWSVHVYSSLHRTDDELEATCYLESEVKGRTGMSVQYNLCNVAKVYKSSWTDESLLTKLKVSCYGFLLPSVEVGDGTPMPFNPFHEVKEALRNQGFYPSVKVLSELLPPKSEPADSSATSGHVEETSTELLDELLEELVDTEVEESDEERSVAGSLSGNESDGKGEEGSNGDE